MIAGVVCIGFEIGLARLQKNWDHMYRIFHVWRIKRLLNCTDELH